MPKILRANLHVGTRTRILNLVVVFIPSSAPHESAPQVVQLLNSCQLNDLEEVIFQVWKLS